MGELAYNKFLEVSPETYPTLTETPSVQIAEVIEIVEDKKLTPTNETIIIQQVQQVQESKELDLTPLVGGAIDVTIVTAKVTMKIVEFSLRATCELLILVFKILKFVLEILLSLLSSKSQDSFTPVNTNGVEPKMPTGFDIQQQNNWNISGGNVTINQQNNFYNGNSN